MNPQNTKVPKYPNAQSGFTLIELLVTTALAILLMLTAASVFMTFLIGGAKNNLAQRVKTEGNHALNQMEFILRNARQITTNNEGGTCTEGMNSIGVIGIDGETTILKAMDDGGDAKIASSGANGDFFLTSSQTTLATPAITFNCYSGANNSHYVNISFTLHRGQDSTAVESDRQNVVETFTTGISLRN